MRAQRQKPGKGWSECSHFFHTRYALPPFIPLLTSFGMAFARAPHSAQIRPQPRAPCFLADRFCPAGSAGKPLPVRAQPPFRAPPAPRAGDVAGGRPFLVPFALSIP